MVILGGVSMYIFLNILITIIISILTCIVYDVIKSYLLTKKLRDLNCSNSGWEDFWKGNFPSDNDFIDKEEK